MTALPVPDRRMTPEEYFDFEQTSETKHEYFEGQLLDMSGGSIYHSAITTNLIGELYSRLKGSPCRVFESNLRVRVKRRTVYSYPDLLIVCGPPDHDPDDRHKTTITNPRVVFEVLSPSTEAYDRGAKFKRYTGHATLEEYILVCQDEPSIDVFWKNPSGTWELRNTDGIGSTLSLRAIPSIQIAFADIYRDVEFPKPKE
jgi:Uma2 family endonuclease